MDNQTATAGIGLFFLALVKGMFILFCFAFAIGTGLTCAWGMYTGNWKPASWLNQVKTRLSRDNTINLTEEDFKPPAVSGH